MTVAAIILAAGFGTRLAPLTDSTPKPLLQVGTQPVISHLLDRLHELPDLAQVAVVVNDQHPAQWNTWRDQLASSVRVQIISNGVRQESERLGAVADMSTAIDALGDTRPDQIVVLAGDNLIDEPLAAHVQAASDHGRPIVLCRDLGPHVPARRFGEITVDADQVITRFREKPDVPQSPLAATCSYVLPGSIGADVATYLNAAGDADSPGSFVAWLAARRPVVARVLTGRYFDIGNHETLAAARAAYRPTL